ncbi:MAG: hypothetical protein ACK5NK_16910 [Niabella sp.]
MKHYITILFLLVFFNAIGQLADSTQLHSIKIVSGNYSSFSVDNLDNIYLLSTSNQLKKLNNKGDSVAVFNNIKRFGEATLVDASNPLKILLYYKSFATIVILDGMLNQKNVIDLRKSNMFRVSAVALSYDGKIWLYDELENCIKKINDKGELIFKTPDLRQVFSETLSPVKIFDQNQYLYLYDSQKGIYVFDYYGAFKTRIDITGWHSFRISNNYAWGTDSTNIYNYEIPVLRTTTLPLPDSIRNYKQLWIGTNYSYGLNDKGLHIMSIP